MDKQHSGRIGQTLIYTGKLFRMFIYKNDWKVLPMAAIIAALVSYVIGKTLFVSMRGTLVGAFGITCICIWNGCFNSIQAVCRERPIVKREHRAGLHMTSYIAAHMIYQAFICLCQTVIIIVIMHIAKVKFPEMSYVTGNVDIDMLITMFLTTYAADMIALFVSSVVRNTTTAMTVMPFVMIFQLIFSGGFFSLSGAALKVTDYAVSKWGLNAMCAIGEYNDLPNDIILGAIDNMDVEKLGDTAPTELAGSEAGISFNDAAAIVQEFLRDPETREMFIKKCGEMAYNDSYRSSVENIGDCWLNIILSTVLFAALSVISLEFIDKDKR